MTKINNKVSSKVNKIPINKTVTVADKAQALLTKEAEKLIARIESSGFKQNHVAEKMGVDYTTLSRFMNQKQGFVTRAMVDKCREFLDKYVQA